MQKKQPETEKNKAKAEKKVEKKEAASSPEAVKSRQTIIKSVTAVICTAVFCLTASSAMDALSQAVSEKATLADNSVTSDAAGNEAAAQNDAGGFVPAPSGGNTSSDSYVPSYDGGSSENVDTPAAADNTSGTGNNTPAPKTADPNDPLNYSVAQLVNYYNSCLKKTYNLPNLTIEKTEDIKIVIDDVTPGGEKVANFGNKIVDKYAKATDFKDTFKNGKSTTGGDGAEEFSMHASLAPAGAKNAAIKKSGNGYEIRILVVPEKATLDKKPTYNSQCSNPLDLGAVDLFGLKVTQADFNYPGTMLIAIVDSEGRVKSAECTMPMNGTGSGKFIISGSATVHGSMVKSAKFSF